MKPRVLAFVLAGGRGSRLGTLTADRAKPAVSFGGKYRIIDFVLSNIEIPTSARFTCLCRQTVTLCCATSGTDGSSAAYCRDNL